MKYKDLEKELFTTKINLTDDIWIELCEPKTKEYLKLRKIINEGNEDNTFDYFFELLPSVLVSSNIDDADNSKVIETIRENFRLFFNVLNEYASFLSNTQMKKK